MSETDKKPHCDCPRDKVRMGESIITYIWPQEGCPSCWPSTTTVSDTGDTAALDFKQSIHHWFELSYAQYLTIPRSALQSMPMDWQYRFTECLNMLDETINWRPKCGRYWVRLKDNAGRYVHDPLMEYRHASRLPRSDGQPWKGGTDQFFQPEDSTPSDNTP